MKTRNKFIVLFILFIWFILSFVTNILGPLMPMIIDNYNLSLTLAAFLPFSFFLAYGLMSIPAGYLIESFGEKISMMISFLLTFSGAAIFSIHPSYYVALISLFIIGVGMAMIQVIINPLMRVAGGEENFAFFSVMGQLVFGAASFVSPFVFTYMIKSLSNPSEDNLMTTLLHQIIPDNLPWVSLYVIFALVFLIVLVIVPTIKFPKVDLKEDEKVGAVKIYIELIKSKRILLYFGGIMAYVGAEQGIANWMSKFLHTYHNIDPTGVGANVISWFWGSMSIGCIVGLLLLKLVDSKLVLKLFTTLSVASLLAALYGSSSVSIVAFPTIGFFISVMFSIVFSLGLNSVKNHHGAFSGILCSGIFGGALVPLIVGWLGDLFGLKVAMLFIIINLAYIYYIASIARPIINNKTYTLKELISKILR